jgi:hypothetical protein
MIYFPLARKKLHVHRAAKLWPLICGACPDGLLGIGRLDSACWPGMRRDGLCHLYHEFFGWVLSWDEIVTLQAMANFLTIF